MDIKNVPFETVDWDKIPAEEHPGDRGTSSWRTRERGALRLRVVEYSPGFVADHWCSRGHVLLVLEGQVRIDLKDGRSFLLDAGSGFEASDDEANPHFVRSDPGARVFIAD